MWGRRPTIAQPGSVLSKEDEALEVFRLRQAEALAEQGSVYDKAFISKQLDEKAAQQRQDVADSGSSSSETDSSSESSGETSSASEGDGGGGEGGGGEGGGEGDFSMDADLGMDDFGGAPDANADDGAGSGDDASASAGAEAEDADDAADEEKKAKDKAKQEEKEAAEKEKADEASAKEAEDKEKADAKVAEDKEKEAATKKAESEKDKEKAELDKESAMLSLSMEDGMTFGDVLMKAGSFTYDTVKQLAVLGIKYGPGIANSIYKGVVAGFRILAKLYLASTKKIREFQYSQGGALKEVKSSLDEARLLAQQIQKAGLKKTAEGVYTNAKVANALCYKGSTDVAANIQRHTKAYQGAMDSVLGGLRKENLLTADLSRHDAHAKIPFPAIPARFVSATGPDYQSVSDELLIYRYSENFISELALAFYLPDPKKVDIDRLPVVLTQARSVLIFETSKYGSVESLNYMDLAGVLKVLDSLETLLNALVKQHDIFKDILSEKDRQKSLFREFFQKIATSEEKVGISESHIDHVVARSKFADDTYLVAIMDSQTLSVRVLKLALEYVGENLKRLM